jgi:hypothetical protein
MSTSAADNSQTHFIMTDKITTEELRELASSTHPLHGDLVRVAKELLAENEAVLTILHQWEERCDKAEAERDALRAEVERLKSSPVVEFTDEMVERACVELAEGDWALYGEEWQEATRRVMRVALVAAFGGLP